MNTIDASPWSVDFEVDPEQFVAPTNTGTIVEQVATEYTRLEHALRLGRKWDAEVVEALIAQGYCAYDVGALAATTGVTKQDLAVSLTKHPSATRTALAGFSDRLEHLEATSSGSDSYVDHTVRCPLDAATGDMDALARAAWNALAQWNEPKLLFRFGDAVFRLMQDHDGRVRLSAVTESEMKWILARAVLWLKRVNNSVRDCRQPADLAKDLLAHPEPPLPPLDLLTTTPLYTHEGLLLAVPGYDEQSRTYLTPSDLIIPYVLRDPPKSEVQAAVTLLYDLIEGFPFVSQADRATAIGMILLPFVRAMIAGPTPLHLIKKPSAGTGATLLTEVCSYIALGEWPAAQPECRSDDEWRKTLTAVLLGNPRLVFIDNLNDRLDSGALALTLTSTSFTSRILGVSRMATMPVRCVWIATGNNPDVSFEMSRRIVPINLDAGVEQPWRKDRSTFRHPDLKGWVRERRSDLVHACLTLIAAWIAADRPSGTQGLGMFDEWAKTIGGILKVAGVDGFLTNLDDLYVSADAEGQEWRSFVSQWHEVHETRTVGVKELLAIAESVLDLGDGTERSRQTRLGRLLKKKSGAIFAGFRITPQVKKENAGQWRLEPRTTSSQT